MERGARVGLSRCSCPCPALILQLRRLCPPDRHVGCRTPTFCCALCCGSGSSGGGAGASSDGRMGRKGALPCFRAAASSPFRCFGTPLTGRRITQFTGLVCPRCRGDQISCQERAPRHRDDGGSVLPGGLGLPALHHLLHPGKDRVQGFRQGRAAAEGLGWAAGQPRQWTGPAMAAGAGAGWVRSRAPSALGTKVEEPWDCSDSLGLLGLHPPAPAPPTHTSPTQLHPHPTHPPWLAQGTIADVFSPDNATGGAYAFAQVVWSAFEARYGDGKRSIALMIIPLMVGWCYCWWWWARQAPHFLVQPSRVHLSLRAPATLTTLGCAPLVLTWRCLLLLLLLLLLQGQFFVSVPLGSCRPAARQRAAHSADSDAIWLPRPTCAGLLGCPRNAHRCLACCLWPLLSATLLGRACAEHPPTRPPPLPAPPAPAVRHGLRHLQLAHALRLQPRRRRPRQQDLALHPPEDQDARLCRVGLRLCGEPGSRVGGVVSRGLGLEVC